MGYFNIATGTILKEQLHKLCINFAHGEYKAEDLISNPKPERKDIRGNNSL